MKAVDFVAHVRKSSMEWKPIVRSLLDVDFYKFTMGLFIHTFYRDVNVKFGFINRHLHIPVAKIVDEASLRRELDHVRTLTLRRTDIAWLRGQDYYGSNLFPDAYLKFLSELKLPEYNLTRVGDQYELTFEGPWGEVSLWETIALAIVSELFYRKLMQGMSETQLYLLYDAANVKQLSKLCELLQYPSITFADFSQRRRHSFLWQQHSIAQAKAVMKERFTGTSNTWMAFNLDLVGIGTNAHELPMVVTAIARSNEEMYYAQYRVLEQWSQLFNRGGLRIVLADTYGSEQFFANMPEPLAEEVARHWRGVRLDSGDPIIEANSYIDWLKSFGVDPIKGGKIVIPSDGLDVDSMIEIDGALRGRIAHPYGWGTNFANDFRGCHPQGDEEAAVDGERLNMSWDTLFRGHSFVCKVVSANDAPAVKLSNNVAKATGDAEAVKRYIKIFGDKGRATQEVSV